MNQEKIIETINAGGIVVMPTDTIYGMLASALRPVTIERLYKLRRRNREKPFIILISSLGDLEKFGVTLSATQKKMLAKIWPGPTSVVLGKTAFRLPASGKLRELISKTGPLMAPSANLAGAPPATTIAEAKNYFGNKVDLYIDGGTIIGKPSTLVRMNLKGEIHILRGSMNTLPNTKKVEKGA